MHGLFNWRFWYTLGTISLFVLSFFLPQNFIYIPLIAAFLPISTAALGQLRHKRLGTEVFLVIATAISFLGHGEQAITIVLIIMLIAEYLEDIIESKTKSAIESLLKLIPETVLIKTDGQEACIPLGNVMPGMHIIVKTGGKIPVDGTIIEGTAAINEASLTGESTLQDRTVGALVYAGTFIEAGSIVVKAEKVGESTFFGKIRSLIEQAEKKKAHIALLSDHIAYFFVPLLLSLIALVWLITHNTQKVVTLLVFGSPLELTLITPLAILAGTIAAFKQGILVKGGNALESYASIDTIIFDKTGTLTLGEPEVVEIEVSGPQYSREDILKIAAIAEKRSGHSLAKAVLKKAQAEQLQIPDPENYTSLAGHGIEITYNNKKYFVGSKHFIEAPEHGHVELHDVIHSPFERYSVFYIGCSGQLCGKIYVADVIRSDALNTVNYFKNKGIRVLLLSGDRQEVTEYIAQSLGIKEAYGGMLPDKKLEIIKSLQNKGHTIAMVGDGINDAPALKQASVGIALGAMGMEPAVDAADLVLMTNDLQKVTFVHRLSRKVLSVIKQNIFIGFMLIHTFGILLALLRDLNPVQAALFHAVPDLLILINSARLISFKMD